MKKPLLAALILSLGLNFYLLSKTEFAPQSGKNRVLASFGGERLNFSDLSTDSQSIVTKMRRSADEVVYRATEKWAEIRIVPKEAAARSMSAEELLSKEVLSKVTVWPEEMARRMAISPDADKTEYPQALKSIEKQIRSEKAADEKSRYLESLYPKYQVKVLVPKGDRSIENFVPYQAPTDPALPSIGPADAPVVMEVFTDFLCPYSRQFSATPRELQKEYPDKLRIVFRQFPLPMHPGADLMGQGAACAQDQGKFWEYHDRLMQGERTPLDKKALTSLAGELGLDVPSFDRCLTSERSISRVQQDVDYGHKMGAQGTPAYAFNGRLGFGAAPLQTLKSFVGWFLRPEGAYPGRQQPMKPVANVPRPQIDPNKVHEFPSDWLQSGPSKGPENASVTIVEFYDYNCPFCQKGAATIEAILKDRKDIRVLPKHFPLPTHKNAMKTAQAIACAEDEGKFWEYRAEVFGESWGKSGIEDLKAIAKKSGLKEDVFAACLDGDKTKERVEKDLKTGSTAGVSGTPAYFINGRFVSGAQTREVFENLIEEVTKK